MPWTKMNVMSLCLAFLSKAMAESRAVEERMLLDAGNLRASKSAEMLSQTSGGVMPVATPKCMIAGVAQQHEGQRIKLTYLQVVSGKGSVPMATVKLDIDGEECVATSSGNGPVDAAFSAVRSLVHRKITLEEFLVQAITRGTDDMGKVHVEIENKGNLYYGFSANTDIITAATEAYVNAISKIL